MDGSLSPARRGRAAIAAVALATVLVLAPVGAAHAQQDPTSTTEATSTSSDLLVPGDGTEGAESTTSTTTETQSAAADEGGLSDATLITLVIAGLLVVAVLVGVLTWRYWIATRPVVGDEARK